MQVRMLHWHLNYANSWINFTLYLIKIKKEKKERLSIQCQDNFMYRIAFIDLSFLINSRNSGTSEIHA